MRMKTLAVAAALSCVVAAAAQIRVREPARNGPFARSEDALREAMLGGHNAARAAVGAAPLTWDPRLAEDALGYARELAATDRFAHSAGRRSAQGENLWTGTRLDYSYDEMIGSWLEEARDVRPGVVPDVSLTGRFEDVSHYVQIVWPTTRRFGCALADNAASEYLVCRYSPPGNMRGKRFG